MQILYKFNKLRDWQSFKKNFVGPKIVISAILERLTSDPQEIRSLISMCVLGVEGGESYLIF